MDVPTGLGRREFLKRAGAVTASMVVGGGAAGLAGARLARSHPRLANWVTELGESLELDGIIEGFLADRARALLEEHTRAGELSRRPVTYLIPSVKYRNYWYWDNMLGALAASYLLPDLARELLRSQAAIYELLGRHGPQIIYFGPAGLPLESRVFQTTRTREGVDQLTQTPVAGLALQAYLRLTGDLVTAREVLPHFSAHYAWLAEARIIDPGVGLPVTIHPFESLDAQPAVDLMYGRSMARTQTFQVFALRSHRHNRSHGFDAPEIARTGGFVMYDTCFLSYYAAGLYGLAEAWRRVGDRTAARAWQQQAERAIRTLIDACYDPAAGFFYGRRANGRGEILRVKTASGLLPLLLPLPEVIADRLVAHLADPDAFLGEERHLPFVARDDPRRLETVEPLWRGPGSPVMDFGVGLGLFRHGQTQLGRELHRAQEVRSVLSHLSGHPFPEFHEPRRSYRGPYTWGTLAACDPSLIA